MRKTILSLLLIFFLCLSANAQMVGATNSARPVSGGDWSYTGWQVSVNGVCTIGPVWFLAAGSEIHIGKRIESGLYYGLQIGGGWAEMDKMCDYFEYTEGGSSWRWPSDVSGAFIPIRADLAYFFGSKRFQPFAHFAPGMFFIPGQIHITAFDFQTGPGLLFALTRQFSLQGEVDLDFCIANSSGLKYSNWGFYSSSGTRVRLAPAIKLGLAYHF